MGMIASRPTCAIATVICFSVAVAAPAAGIAAGEGYKITGKILSFDGITPVSGVIVLLIDSSSGAVHRSRPTSPSGQYQIPEVMDGEYFISIESGEETIELPNEIVIRGGQPRAITVILPQTASEAIGGVEPEERRRRSLAWLAWPIGGGGLLLAAIILSNANDDDDEDVDASPSTP
jgi:hypothetical protein